MSVVPGSHLSRIVDRASSSFPPLSLSAQVQSPYYVLFIRSEISRQVGVWDLAACGLGKYDQSFRLVVMPLTCKWTYQCQLSPLKLKFVRLLLTA